MGISEECPRKQMRFGRVSEYFSKEEAKDIISESTSKDRKQMLISAKRLVCRYKLSSTDPEDLLQEALCKTLAGKRSWKRKIPIVFHIYQTMRSIASHYCEHSVRFKNVEDVDSLYALNASPEYADSNTEEISIRRQEIQNILSYFKDDVLCHKTIQFQAQGMTGTEIQKTMQLTAQEWAALKKRTRRKIIEYINRHSQKK